MAATARATASAVTVGANFEGANFGASGIFPPDSDGAIGSHQFVELVNGAYRVYDKAGTLLQQSSLDEFWSSAGAPTLFAGDPRVLYDPESQRWFAAALDFGFAPSPYLLAVSNTSDPTQGWHAFAFGQTFDFTELGINRDAVYLSTTGFSAPDTEVVVIPKADLLATTPTIANATFLSTFFANTGPSPQPAVAPDLSGAEALLGLTSGSLLISSVDSPATAPVLDTEDRTISIPLGAQNTPGATQKDSTLNIATGNAVFSSSVVMQGGKLFAVETIGLNPDQSHAALRWFEIGDPLTAPVVLDSGIISPPGLEVYYGSIAVNPLGEVVIGFSGSGTNDYPSAYAVAGTLNGDVLQFGDPMLLKAGVAPATLSTNGTQARFGDYSTTTYDPTDPSHFWTVQEWEAASGWSTEISEIVFSPPPPTVQTWFGGRGDFSDPQNWLPPGSPAATDTLVIDAGRAVATNLTITNPTLQLGSSATPTLVLRDSTLAATDHVEVQSTARIRVAGTVTEDGTIDVSGNGSTLDVNGPGQSAQFVNDGEVEALGGTVRMNVAVTGQGTFDDSLGGTLEFTKAVGAGETVKLDAGLLILDRPKDFAASIQDFNSTSTIELAHTSVTSTDYSNGVLTLFDKHRVAAQLNIVGDFTSEQFAVANQGGNAFITVDSQVAQLVSAMAAHSADASGLGATAPPTLNDSTLQNILAPTGHS